MDRILRHIELDRSKVSNSKLYPFTVEAEDA